MGAKTATRGRVRADVVRMAHRATGLSELARVVGRCIHRAVPFDGRCLLTVDPATMLPTGEVVENGLPAWAQVRMTQIELGESDVNKFTALARAPLAVATLSEATGGDLDRSRRQRELRRPSGFGDELRAVLTGPSGTWGTLTLLREEGRANFTPADVRFVASVTASLAEGVRRVSLVEDDSDDNDPSTGFLVLAPDGSVELANAAAERWIEELVAPGAPSGALSVAIRAVAAHTRRVGAGDRTESASARVHTRAGHWLVVRGALVDGGRVSVLLEAARPPELAAAIADVYGFTERERTITAFVARGLTTDEIADHLHLSAYTVQDHLKSIFDKSGTSTRGALVARLFFDQQGSALPNG